MPPRRDRAVTRQLRLAFAVVALLAATSCNVTTAVTSALEIVIGSGDGQFGVVGTQLPRPLRVIVRSAATGQPRRDATVLWDVASGGATLVGASTVTTDSTGAAEVRVRLGDAPGPVAVRARLADQPGSVSFGLFGVDRPTLEGVEPASAAAGDTVTITGANFSPVALQNVVLFSGMRGEVVEASGSSLRVVVPPCMPARSVNLLVQLGSVASADTLAFTVTSAGAVTQLQVGQVLDVADDEGLECHLLAGGSNVWYLTLVYSASAVGAARHPYRFTALSSGGPAFAPERVAERASEPVAPDETDLQVAWDEHVRTLERDLIRRMAPTPPSGRPATVSAPAAVPVVGERRSFQVLNASGGFDQVGAVARSIGSRAAIFVDTLAPAGGFTTTELDELVARFDDVIYPRITTTFGSPSDLDGNGRIIILFTPAVNRLTPPSSTSFVGGFFYGVDLLPSSTGSNAAEVFYAIVPDPMGEINGNVRMKRQVADVVPSVLAHEFQHMVHFNERIVVRKAPSQEALWLSEGLAQMAEEMVYRDYAALGDTAGQRLFRTGTRQRARLYVERPDTVSLIATAGQGSLPERGAGFLYVLYLEDQWKGDLLARLTRTMRTGVANVEAETGRAWADLIADWWSAMYLDDLVPTAPHLQYPNIDLRGFLLRTVASTNLGSGATSSGTLWSSSVRYYFLQPGASGTAVRLGGERGAPSAPQAALRLRIVRIS